MYIGVGSRFEDPQDPQDSKPLSLKPLHPLGLSSRFLIDSAGRVALIGTVSSGKLSLFIRPGWSIRFLRSRYLDEKALTVVPRSGVMLPGAGRVGPSFVERWLYGSSFGRRRSFGGAPG